MTRGSIREYTEAVRGWYHWASKKEKGRILDGFTNVIGCHRKTAAAPAPRLAFSISARELGFCLVAMLRC